MNSAERRELIEKRKQRAERTERLWVQGQWQAFEVWRVPVDALLLNIDNLRFAAERQLFEDQLGRSLDPENNPEDELSVEAILLDDSLELDGDRIVGNTSKEAYALQEDWDRRKQERPLWIRPDGTVRNGNRRLAMLRRLQRGRGRDGYDMVDVVVLDPEKIDETTLFEMEQREQLTEDFKVRYTDINLLIAIKFAAEALGVDWYDDDSIERTASELQHIVSDNPDYAIVQLNAIKFMDAYLDDLGHPGEYHLLLRQIERFRDIGRAMRTIRRDYPSEAVAALRIFFAAVSAGMKHQQIRTLRQMFFKDRPRFMALLESVQAAEAEWVGRAGETPLGAPDLRPVEVDEITQERDLPGPAVDAYPQQAIQRDMEHAIDGYLAAARADVVRSLEQAHNRLQALTDERQLLTRALGKADSAEVRAALLSVVAWVDKHRTVLDDAG